MPSLPANAGLLDDYGSDPNVDKEPAKKTKELARDKGKPESNSEPNLRSNYYYPTNKGECCFRPSSFSFRGLVVKSVSFFFRAIFISRRLWAIAFFSLARS
jgi:hypothetical protein